MPCPNGLHQGASCHITSAVANAVTLSTTIRPSLMCNPNGWQGGSEHSEGTPILMGTALCPMPNGLTLMAKPIASPIVWPIVMPDVVRRGVEGACHPLLWQGSMWPKDDALCALSK